MTNAPPKPQGFRPAQDVARVFLECCAPAFTEKKKRSTAAAKAGIAYERKVQTILLDAFSRAYLPNPWLRFFDASGMRWCQPDGLFIYPKAGRVVIVEIKHGHTSQAWWKLLHLYRPVVQALFGAHWDVRMLEIVRWYDPAELFPGGRLRSAPNAAPAAPEIGIHILNPRAGYSI